MADFSEEERGVITIVCVAYRRPAAIQVLIHAFLAQTSQDYRLMIIHDGPDERMEALLAEYCERFPERMECLFTEKRHNDFGHSLRQIGLERTTSEFVMFTNDDNYYVPTFVEIVTATLHSTQCDVVLFDVLHSHENAGDTVAPAYSVLTTEPRMNRFDVGAGVFRTSLAKSVGWRDRSFAADGVFIEDVMASDARPKVVKIPQVLFVHN